MWKHAELPGLGISSAFGKSLEVQLVKKKNTSVYLSKEMETRVISMFLRL